MVKPHNKRPSVRKPRGGNGRGKDPNKKMAGHVPTPQEIRCTEEGRKLTAEFNKLMRGEPSELDPPKQPFQEHVLVGLMLAVGPPALFPVERLKEQYLKGSPLERIWYRQPYDYMQKWLKAFRQIKVENGYTDMDWFTVYVAYCVAHLIKEQTNT